MQNTGRANAGGAAKRLNELFGLGIDLVAHPELRGDPKISALSLFIGNREGWWTGKDLGDYLDCIDEDDDEDLREFIEARRVVNGTDKAKLIAGYAVEFDKALEAGGYVAAPVPDETPTIRSLPSQWSRTGSIPSPSSSLSSSWPCVELLERDRAQHSRMITEFVNKVGNGFADQQLAQIRSAFREQLADAGLRIDGPDHQDEAREDFRFLRRIRKSWDTTTARIGGTILTGILLVPGVIVSTGSWAWIISGGN